MVARLPKAGYVVDAIVAAQSAWELRHLKFKPLPSGRVSVSASGIPKGTRIDFFDDVVEPSFSKLKPGAYKPTTIGSIVKDGLIKSVKSSLPAAGLLSLGVNLYDYGKDATSLADFSDKTIENREFWVSTVVDTVVSVAIGVGAAALAVALLPVAAPVAATIAVAALIAIAGGLLFDAVGGPKLIKDGVNTVLDNMAIFR